MKHKIKKFNDFSAGCTNPGCVASLSGGVVKEIIEFWEKKGGEK